MIEDLPPVDSFRICWIKSQGIKTKRQLFKRSEQSLLWDKVNVVSKLPACRKVGG